MFVLKHCFRLKLMKQNFFLSTLIGVLLFLGTSLSINVFFQPAHASTVNLNQQRPNVASGETQVLAKIGKREITVSELRVELQRLGYNQVTPEGQRFAMQNIINRHLLVEKARKAGSHRKPEIALRMRAAQEQALADFYLGSASHPPEPTLAEIEDYILAHPGLFANRRLYDFVVITLDTEIFNEKLMTSMFSETKDFSAFENFLTENKMNYNKSLLSQPSSSFPREIRDQLAQYAPSDNIVIKGGNETQIMKILTAKVEPIASEQWSGIARRLVMEEHAVRRARSLMDSLKVGQSIIYYQKDLAPVAAKKDQALGEKQKAGK